LILGGVEIAHHQGLAGHSDADVLCHAVSDALLGAAALGDIGQHYPDTDDRYKDADSLALLRETVSKIVKLGWRVVNIDTTLVLQRPKVAPFVEQMRKNIAAACAIETDCVSIKATTTERLGFTGREEGAAAHAVVLIQKEGDC
ncbi:MAG: 2-C-methyl-D-erythritol 2,4-cyclodiphosphate synthase, partial [candidate division KSB1 bacterium]|nr:2-C-methyl-D-erythritol 2,4-cyclodiphosphate synthase [candidate division KSB1 bacterium]